MKPIKTYFHAFAALLAGCAMVSCTTTDDFENGGKVPGTDEPGDPGLISVVMTADNASGRTRVSDGSEDPTYLQFKQEEDVYAVRIILYDQKGYAKYVRDYDPNDDDLWFSKEELRFQTKAFEVVKQPYQLAVLVNYKNEWNYFTADRVNKADTDIEYRTRLTGHHKSVLTDTPLDFAAQSGANYYKAKSFAMQTLTGLFDTPPSYASIEYLRDNMSFFMSNADGLVDISVDDIKTIVIEDDPAEVEKAKQAAEADPVNVRVERGVAKVAFFVSRNLYMSPYFETPSMDTRSIGTAKPLNEAGDNLVGIWRTDMTNMKMYPIRKHNLIAPLPMGPGAGLSMEVPTSDRRDRYATDPNQDMAPGNNYIGQLFSFPNVDQANMPAVDPIYAEIDPADSYGYENYMGLPLMYGNDYMSDKYIDLHDENAYNTYEHMEYVMENTLSPENFHTSTTTNIVLILQLRLQYYIDYGADRRSAPGALESTGEYVLFDGVMYPGYFIFDWLKESDDDYWSLSTYFDFVTGIQFTTTELNKKFTEQQKAEMLAIYFDSYGDIIKEGEMYGMKFFLRGLNYYRVPIRHFKSGQSPSQTGYGRYGVVRNNTYVLTLESVLGPGSPTDPGPGPIVDPDPNKYLTIMTGCYPWLYRPQYGQIGEDNTPPPAVD